MKLKKSIYIYIQGGPQLFSKPKGNSEVIKVGDLLQMGGKNQKYRGNGTPKFHPFVHRVFHEIFTIHFGGFSPYFWSNIHIYKVGPKN